MKFLLLSQFAGAPKYGMVFRNYTWGKELVKQGHEVTIIASSYSHTRNKNPSVSSPVTEEKIDGIRYLWIKGLRYDAKQSIKRTLAMFYFSVKILFLHKKILDEHYDIVIASSPQPFDIYPAYYISKKNNAKLVYDIRDLWPLTLKELGNMSSYHPIIWLMQRAENFACRSADLITSVPQNCHHYLIEKGMYKDNFMFLPNGIDDDTIEENSFESLPEEHMQTIKNIKKSGALTIGYAGAIADANALHILIKGAHLANANAHIILMGKGSKLNELKSLTIDLGIKDKVTFLPPVLRKQVKSFLHNIDIAYIGLLDKELFKMGISPTKLNDYMISKKPILYAIGDTPNIVDIADCGISCGAENPKTVALAIDELSKKTEDELKNSGENGYKWLVKNQRVSDQMKKIVQHLSN